MPDPLTGNVSLSVPVRGTDTGTWDTPVNGNFTSIDSMLGGVTTLALSSASVTLLTSQAYNSVIRITGTLTASIPIFVSAAGLFKSWTIDNQITNSPSSFAVALNSSVTQLGLPPGVQDVFFDGTTIKYRNLGKIGEYWDYAAASVPTWVTLTAPNPPYLNCNGTTFSSATYPILANLLGTTTLPDSRGFVRIAMNQGTSRVTVVNGDVIFSTGGDQNLQAHVHTGSGTTSNENVFHQHFGSGTTTGQSNNHTHHGAGTTSGFSADHTHAYTAATNSTTTGGGGFAAALSQANNTGVQSNNHTHTYDFVTDNNNADHSHNYSFNTGNQSIFHTHTYSFSTSFAGGGIAQNIQPSYVGGITMIRAA